MKLKKQTLSAIVIVTALMTVIGLSGLNFLLTPGGRTSEEEIETANDFLSEGVMEKETLITEDNVKIAANLYTVPASAGWIVMSHMMPATKESWDSFAEALQNLGYESIAIDLRGHGESEGGPDGYRSFSDAEQQKKILDLEAAVDYLVQKRKATPEKIVLIGASIGANLSLQYLSQHPEFKKAIQKLMNSEN